MTNQECIKLFETYLKDEKNASKNTLESYMRDIRQLSEFLEESCGKSLAAAKSSQLEDYIERLRASGKSVATVSRAIASIKSFYMQLCIKQVIKNSPATSLSPEKSESKIPEIMSHEEVDRFLRQPKCIDAKGYRDHAMLELLYATGMRVSELLDMNLEDVNLDRMLVRCGESRPRVVPIHSAAVSALREYIDYVRPQMVASEEENALFVNVQGERMSRQGFWKLIKLYAKKAKIDKDITPHTLRHSFAAHMIENGADVHSVQELLGHVDLSSTKLYRNVIAQA